MGIKNLRSGLNETGKIKIGEKGKEITSSNGNKFRPPVKFDHFEITLTDRNADGDLVKDQALIKRIIEAGTGITNEKGELVGIPVRFLYNDTDLNFPTEYRSHVKGKLSCRGDGEQSFKSINDFNPEKPGKCPCDRQKPGYDGRDKCKATGKLSCVIDEAGLFGQCHVFRTTSINSIMGIMGGIELIRAATGGKIAGLPLMLTLNPKHTVVPGTGAATIVYVVSVCYRGTMSDLRNSTLQMIQEEKQYLIGMEDIEEEAKRAGVGTVVTPDEESDERAEFFPDAAIEADYKTVGNEAGSTVDPAEPLKAETESGGDEPENMILLETTCSVCNEPQYETLAGVTCKNGHGGAVSAEEVEEKRLAQIDLIKRLNAEPDSDKAIKLANRINTPFLVEWAKEFFSEIGKFPASEKSKTMWMAYIKKYLPGVFKDRGPLKLETEKNQGPNASELAKQRLVTFAEEIKEFPADMGSICGFKDHNTAVRYIRARFDCPIDATVDMDGLCKNAVRLLREERDSQNKKEKETVEKETPVKEEPKDAGSSDNSTDTVTEPEIDPNDMIPDTANVPLTGPDIADTDDPYAWDDGELIVIEQKRELKDIYGGKWRDKDKPYTKEEWAACVSKAKYTDKDGAVICSAMKMTERQAAHFIASLDPIPF